MAYTAGPRQPQYAPMSSRPAPTLQTTQAQPQQQQGANGSKPADYVYFDRTTAGFSEDAIHRAKAAQLKLENYYKLAVDSAVERNTRCVVISSVRTKPRGFMYS